MPVELWSDDPELKKQVLADSANGKFPAPPQPNVRSRTGLFSEALTRYLKDGWPQDLRLVHMDADSTSRPAPCSTRSADPCGTAI